MFAARLYRLLGAFSVVTLLSNLVLSGLIPTTASASSVATRLHATPASSQQANSLPPRSLSLNGTSAYAEIPNAVDLNPGGDWTVEAWFKRETPGGYDHPPQVLLGKGNPFVDHEVPYFVVIGRNVLAVGERTENSQNEHEDPDDGQNDG